VWLKNQDMPGLAMSRSFGDEIAASVGVLSEPEIIIQNRSENDKFIILGSDGIWEFINNEEMVQIASQFTDGNKACRAIVKEATRKWQLEEDVVDDITVIVVYL